MVSAVIGLGTLRVLLCVKVVPALCSFSRFGGVAFGLEIDGSIRNGRASEGRVGAAGSSVAEHDLVLLWRPVRELIMARAPGVPTRIDAFDERVRISVVYEAGLEFPDGLEVA